jgi:drug/metabolite transporter (DMT)-like permease
MNRSLQSIDATLSGARMRTGLALAGATALVSGISVFVNASAVRAFDDPVLFTTLKNGVAAVLLVTMALAVVRGPWVPKARAMPGLVALGVLGGSIPFVLFFTGLAEATAPAAAVIHKTLFVWVAILAVVLLGERLGRLQLAAIGVLLASQLLIQSPTGVGWGTGETLIAAATAFWAVEIIVAKRVLADVRSPVAAAARMGIGLVLLVVFLGVGGGLDGIGSLGPEHWGWVMITGLLLTGYVGTWYAALRRAPASAVTAILTLGAPITAVLQLASTGQVPALGPALGYGIGAAAAVVLAWLALRQPLAPQLPAPAEA